MPSTVQETMIRCVKSCLHHVKILNSHLIKGGTCLLQWVWRRTNEKPRMHWTVHLEGGPRRVNHAAVAIGTNIYSFGGYCTGEDYRKKTPIDVHVFNTITLQWSRVHMPKDQDPSEVPFLRYGHTVVAYGDLAFLWGGRNDEGACNKLYCFDTVSYRWCHMPTKGHIPGARDGHSACIIDKYMYVFGGYEEGADRFSQDVHRLDLTDLTWQYIYCVGAPPRWRDFHSASAIGNRMYIFGGRGDQQGPYHSQTEVYCNMIAYLDTSTMTWVHPVVTGQIPSGRRSHSAFVYENKLYIFGGYNGILERHFNDLHRFNPETNFWSCMKVWGGGPCPRRRQCCCIVGDKLYLFGGTSPKAKPEHSVDLDIDNEMDAADYNLMDHSDLHILDFNPSLRTLCLLTVLENKLDKTYLPASVKKELDTLAATTVNSCLMHTG